MLQRTMNKKIHYLGANNYPGIKSQKEHFIGVKLEKQYNVKEGFKIKI